MKLKFVILLFLTSGLLISVIGQNELRPKSPTELAKGVFESLKNNDFKSFLFLIFTEADCKIMANKGEASDSVKAIVVKQMNALTQHTRQNAKTNFNSILSQTNTKEVKWASVTLTDVKFEIKNRKGIESSDIFLFCRNGEINFIIKLDNCHKSDAWLMMDKIKVRFKE